MIAHNLNRTLRTFDESGVDIIFRKLCSTADGTGYSQPHVKGRGTPGDRGEVIGVNRMDTFKKIIFADSAGNSRAPMAAELLKECTVKLPIDIQARGIVVLFPEPLNQKVEAVLISNGITLEHYMSSQLEEEDFAKDTLIVVMGNSDRQKVLDLFENAIPENVQVLTELVGDELEIMDPYGGTLQSYGLCYETLSKSIKKLAVMLNNNGNE